MILADRPGNDRFWDAFGGLDTGPAAAGEAFATGGVIGLVDGEQLQLLTRRLVDVDGVAVQLGTVLAPAGGELRQALGGPPARRGQRLLPGCSPAPGRPERRSRLPNTSTVARS
jgi:hypothetical protein